MASSIAAITMPRSIDFSRATASAICSSSSLLALTAMVRLLTWIDVAPARFLCGEAMLLGVLWRIFGRAPGATFRLQFRLRFVAFRRGAFSCMSGRRRFETEILLEFALCGLAAP